MGSQTTPSGGMRTRLYHAHTIRGGPETVTVTVSSTTDREFSHPVASGVGVAFRCLGLVAGHLWSARVC